MPEKNPMLDLSLFVVEITALQEVFNRQLGENAMHAYYKTLVEAGIDNDQFRRAIAQIWKTTHYFPAPADIIQAVYGSPHERAIAEWNRVLDAARSGTVPTLSKQAQSIITAFGGMSRLYSATDADIHYLRKEFLALYQQKPQFSLGGK